MGVEFKCVKVFFFFTKSGIFFFQKKNVVDNFLLKKIITIKKNTFMIIRKRGIDDYHYQHFWITTILFKCLLYSFFWEKNFLFSISI